MKLFFTSHLRFIVGIVIVFIIAGTVWYVISNTAPALGAYTIAPGNITASIDIPGTVSSSNSVDLSFQESGQIATVAVQDGDSVTQGEVLASLDASSEQTGLSQEESALAVAQANLNSLEAGSTPQQLALDQAAVASAQTSLLDAIQNGYVQAEDGIQNKIAPFFGTVSTVQEPLVLDSQYDTLLSPMIQTLSTWGDEVNATTQSTPQTLAQDADTYLATLISSVDMVNSDMSHQASETAVSLSTIQPLLAQITAVRLTLTSTKTVIDNAEAALVVAQGTLTLAQAGPTASNVAALQAEVQQAQAAINNAQLTINHTNIVAPFSGIIRNVTAEPGMVVSPNVPVLSIINNNILKIDAYASETDVPQILTNATAAVTLDAYGNSVTFPAEVTAVDTEETTVNGSPAYDVTLYFTQPDVRIRAGMTGNVTIVTTEHDNVVAIPSRLVLDNGGTDFVLLQKKGKSVPQPITLGIMDNSGMVEVISGLTNGEKISDF